MKNLILLLFAVSLCYSVESLEQIYEKYKMAESVAVYEKADESMTVPDEQEYDDLRPEIKEQYKDYADYKTKIVTVHNITKGAIKDKMIMMRVILSNTDYTAEEKAKWDAELIEAIEKIKLLEAKAK